MDLEKTGYVYYVLTTSIYTLTSIIWNQLREKKKTFAAFIDFQKVFHWVDHDVLFTSSYPMISMIDFTWQIMLGVRMHCPVSD